MVFQVRMRKKQKKNKKNGVFDDVLHLEEKKKKKDLFQYE